MSDVVTLLPGIMIEAAQAELHATGGVPRPQVHMLAEDLEKSYIGNITCRRFYRGQDATVAIGDLGIMPSLMKMTRLMVLWEACDLAVAMEQEPGPRALMLVDATLSRHILHRHPFSPVPTGRVKKGIPLIRLEWEPPQQFADARLPAPVARLLQTWRELRDGDIQEAGNALEQSGYEFMFFG